MKHWVYFLLQGKAVIYIGCTKDCDRRINEHRLTGIRFDSVKTIKCANYETAMHYESRWIKRFEPMYNCQNNPSYNPKVGFRRVRSKKNMTILVRKDRAKRLREFAIKEQKTISIVVENALEAQYGL